MKSGKEQIWRQYKRATRLQYICTLLTLHRAFGFGQKRLAEFEDTFSEVVSKVKEYANDDVINEKLADEMKEIGYDLGDLLSNIVYGRVVRILKWNNGILKITKFFTFFCRK